jgi:hypothetical protein
MIKEGFHEQGTFKHRNNIIKTNYNLRLYSAYLKTRKSSHSQANETETHPSRTDPDILVYPSCILPYPW